MQKASAFTEAELYEELKEARESFENIRSILIHTLQGPGRAAFWAAVTAKNRINAILGEPDHSSEDQEIARHTGRGAYQAEGTERVNGELRQRLSLGEVENDRLERVIKKLRADLLAWEITAKRIEREEAARTASK